MSFGLISLVLSQLALGAGTLRFEVTESGSETLVPCRVHLLDGSGKAHGPEGLPFHLDHFTCPGTAELQLTPGRYTYEIERGPERTMASGSVDVPEGEVTVRASLERLIDMPALGWWPGDLHVHRPIEHMELLVKAEGLYVAPDITWWNDRNLWSDRPLPENAVMCTEDNRYVDILAGEDERAGGAFLYFGRNKPLDIAKAQKEYPSAMSFVDEASRDPRTWVDIEKPFWWDVPLALATGHARSIGLANNHMCRSSMFESEAWGKPRDSKRLPPPRGNGFWSQEIYYRILETGLRLPPSAGSASGVLPNPVGYNRVYVQLDGGMDYAKWWDGLAAGRCFVTNGPLLVVKANGQWPGHVFTAAQSQSVDVDVEAALTSRDRVTAFEIVRDGVVERTVPYDEWRKNRSLGSLRFEESGWFLVRTIADVDNTFRFASSAPFYVEIGENRRVSRKAATFFLDWVNERAEDIALTDPRERAEVMLYVDKARDFWEAKVRDANTD